MYSAFHLMDVVEMNKLNPRKYPLPNEEEIRNIKIGDLVKVILKTEKIENSKLEYEHIWLKVVNIEDKKIIGLLEENSKRMQRLKKGIYIICEIKNILNINCDNMKLINEFKNAIITCKAIEHREINWALKTTPLNKYDSGWQFFYGDEEYEYLEKPSNTKTITIKEVLNLEPLLEKIFISRIQSAEYNSKLNKFIEI